MTMRKSRPENSRQFGLDFGDKPKREPMSAPVQQPEIINISKLTDIRPEYKALAMPEDDDKDEDPQAQKGREWREFRGRKRA